MRPTCSAILDACATPLRLWSCCCHIAISVSAIRAGTSTMRESGGSTGVNCAGIRTPKEVLRRLLSRLPRAVSETFIRTGWNALPGLSCSLGVDMTLRVGELRCSVSSSHGMPALLAARNKGCKAKCPCEREGGNDTEQRRFTHTHSWEHSWSSVKKNV